MVMISVYAVVLVVILFNGIDECGAMKLPGWTAYTEPFVTCGGALLEGDVLLTSRRCKDTSMGQRDSITLMSGKKVVKNVYDATCFKDASFEDFVVSALKGKPIKTDNKLTLASPAHLPNQKDSLVGISGVSVGYYSGKTQHLLMSVTGKIVESSNCQDSNGINPMLTSGAAFCVSISRTHVNSQVKIPPGMAFVDTQGHVLGIRIYGKQDVFMRVDKCLDQIQKAVESAIAEE